MYKYILNFTVIKNLLGKGKDMASSPCHTFVRVSKGFFHEKTVSYAMHRLRFGECAFGKGYKKYG